jgi:hypothetical protein
MTADEITPEQEEAVMTAVLPVKVAGAPRRLPILPRKAAREWRDFWRQRSAAEAAAPDIRQSFGEAAELTGEALLDMIVAYDEAIDSRTGEPYHVTTFGGRDELDATASDREIRAIYDVICEEVFSPLVQAGMAPVLAAAFLEVIASRQASFIAGRSFTGDSAPTSSTTGSPNPKSRSSGRKTSRLARKSIPPA